MTKREKLTAYLGGLERATTADELEQAIRAPFEHSYRGATWTRICEVRIRKGREICDAHPLANFVPRVGPRRRLTLCGETYSVGYGGNSTGERYVWHGAGVWAQGVLVANGFSRLAAHRMWEGDWSSYPHRCLKIAQMAMDGKLPDRALNRLRLTHVASAPINHTVEGRQADRFDRRASRPCGCGGTRFDWGGGYSGPDSYIEWRCNRCPRVYVEYMTGERLSQIRRAA